MIQRRRILTVSVVAATLALGGTLTSSATQNRAAVPDDARVVAAAQQAAGKAVKDPYAQIGKGEKVILDTDFGQLNDDSQVLYMLTQSKAKVLGVTTVSGNTWAQEGTAYALRQLERVNRTDIPVIQGLIDPLFGSRQETAGAWGPLYGSRGYTGAWGRTQPVDYRHVTGVYQGSPTTWAQAGSAPDFIVKQVQKNPGEVTIIAIGPLTNIAIAIKNHPEIVPLVKQIIYMGGAFDVPGNDAAPASEFNIWFDPDSARIAFAAPWKKQIIVPLDVTDTVQYGIAQYNRIVAGADTTITKHFKDSHGPRFASNPNRLSDMWDTLTVAIMFDPTLVTQSVERTVTVDTMFGLNYGRTLGYPASTSPAGLQKATIIQRLDNARFYDLFVGLLSAPLK